MNDFWRPSDQSELYHYGVLGMRWGVHKARKYASKNDRAANDGKHIVVTYKDGRRAAIDSQGNSYLDKADRVKSKIDAKATKKFEKLNARYQKKQASADRAFIKAERKANSFFSSERSAKRAYHKASKKQFKANKVAYKGKEWFKQMEKAYKDADMKMTPETRNLGREFVKRVERQSKAMYNAQYMR